MAFNAMIPRREGMKFLTATPEQLALKLFPPMRAGGPMIAVSPNGPPILIWPDGHVEQVQWIARPTS